MKVWWCLEHETSGHPPRCWKQLMTHAYGDCRMVEMQLVPADAETDFSLSNSSVVAPGQRLSEHLSQPERSSTEGRQLVPADARMVSGAQDAIEYLETLGLVHGPLPVQYFMDYFVVVIPEDYPKGPKDLDGVPFKSGDLVDLIRFRSEPLDAVSVPDPTKTEPPKDPWDYDP